ncbi:MAG TPA: hypothetical protein PKO22_08775, partial [Treponemataceae bacterium]|nr:hypothetical protein [Treponemataceae bacterium]
RFYKATPKKGEPIFLECERANDARRVGTVMAGGADVDVVMVEAEEMPRERVQVRWVGSAARRVPDLRIQTRRILADGNARKWKDLR